MAVTRTIVLYNGGSFLADRDYTVLEVTGCLAAAKLAGVGLTTKPVTGWALNNTIGAGIIAYFESPSTTQVIVRLASLQSPLKKGQTIFMESTDGAGLTIVLKSAS